MASFMPAALSCIASTRRVKFATLIHARRCPGTLPADDCRLVTNARLRRLRSADTRTLLVSRTRTNFRL